MDKGQLFGAKIASSYYTGTYFIFLCVVPLF